MPNNFLPQENHKEKMQQEWDKNERKIMVNPESNQIKSNPESFTIYIELNLRTRMGEKSW